MADEKYEVAVLMGSKSDLPKMEGAFAVFDVMGVSYTARVISAHRTPSVAAEFAENAMDNGFKIIICAAGMAAHLAGVIAAHTTLPVIGVPMDCAPFNGLDALLATVQMPPGIPVATVTAGKAGAKNSALFAVAILALSDKKLADKLKAFRKEQERMIAAADAEVSAAHSSPTTI
jgi:phosphoribosylaminoimidazole carboxylase PurE protein